MRRFRATVSSAGVIPGLNAFVVILAENPDGSGARVEIQRSLSFSAQDKRMGQDTYCVSTEDGATHYGGLRSWRFAGERLEIALDEEAARSLGVADGFVVELEPHDEGQQALKDGLRRVLDDDHQPETG